MARERIAVSACLIGRPCRFDGKSKPCQRVIDLQDEYQLVPICPEAFGDLAIPRTPSEQRVVDGVLGVWSKDGVDRTEAFMKGSSKALRIAQENDCKIAVLKAKSPSCGVGQVYDGTFSGKLASGMGTAAKMLADAGIRVITEDDVSESAPFFPEF